MKVERPRNLARPMVVADEQDMLEMRERVADAGHLALVEGFSGDEDAGLTDGESRPERLRPEG